MKITTLPAGNICYGIDIDRMDEFYRKMGIKEPSGKRFHLAFKRMARAVLFAGLAAISAGSVYHSINDFKERARLYCELREGNLSKEEALDYMHQNNITMEDAVEFAKRLGYSEEQIRKELEKRRE